MNKLSLRARIELIGCLGLSTMIAPILQAESRCPGNIAGVSPRIVQSALVVIPVWINQSGPYDFIVDTGSQVTVIEPSLAVELGLRPRGTIGVFTIAGYTHASLVTLNRLEANSRVVENPLAVVRDIREIQAADSRIRGELGENFLGHFDLLIDYAHRLLCLDETNAMRERVRGQHIPLVAPSAPESDLTFGERLVVRVHLSGAGNREISLQLDSGSDGPLLYATQERELKLMLEQAGRRGSNASKAQQSYAVLPPQGLRIGSLTLNHISFVTPVSEGRDVPGRQEDGLLPTLLFQRVFISGHDQFVVFDPW